MKKVTFILSMLLALTCSTVNARTITRCFDSKSQKFCVRMDGQLMTIEEYDNYRGCTFATRTMKWGGKTLTAWAVIDDSGHECSHLVFAGSGEGYGCRWLLEEAGVDYVNVTLQLCADTICWTWGYLDENGKLMMWTGEDDNGKNKYIPWDWKRVDA